MQEAVATILAHWSILHLADSTPKTIALAIISVSATLRAHIGALGTEAAYETAVGAGAAAGAGEARAMVTKKVKEMGEKRMFEGSPSDEARKMYCALLNVWVVSLFQRRCELFKLLDCSLTYLWESNPNRRRAGFFSSPETLLDHTAMNGVTSSLYRADIQPFAKDL
jgi:hypothetical protein